MKYSPAKIPGITQWIHLEETDSTNRVAMELGREGAADGTLIIAERQSQGRGRLDREWISPAGKGLYFSLLLRPTMKAADAPRMTLAAGLGVLDGLRELGFSHLLLKWPNDILINQKKLGGILTEMVAKGSEVDFIVLGIGINVTTTLEDFGKTLAPFATSLMLETNREWDRQEILKTILPKLHAEIKKLVSEPPSQMAKRWNQASGMLGKKIKFCFLHEKIEKVGKVLGLKEDGKLQVALENGEIVGLIAEDVTLL